MLEKTTAVDEKGSPPAIRSLISGQVGVLVSLPGSRHSMIPGVGEWGQAGVALGGMSQIFGM